MSFAIILVIIAQFFNAVVALVDKYIISTKKVPHPSYYAFFVSMLSALSVFVFFFGFISVPFPELSIPSFYNVSIPTLYVTVSSILSGAVFFFALWTLFTAFRHADASDVIPVVGSVSALTAIPLGYYILGTSMSKDFYIGVFLLVLGALLLSHYRFKKKVFIVTVTSGVFFAIYYILLKDLFSITNFDNAFFWSRMGIVFAAIVIFLPRWAHCRECYVRTSNKSNWIIIGNKILAGISGFLLLKAIDLSNVAIVQALGGLQFVFLFAFSLTIGHLLPREVGENVVGRNKIQKTLAISLLVIGFLLLFLL